MKGFRMIFIITIQLLLLSISAFSMNDTIPTPKVVLTQGQALGTIKDLISYDGLKEIQKIMESQMADLRLMLKQKDTIIASHEQTNRKNEAIISKHVQIETNLEADLKTVNRKYRNAVRWGRFKLVLLPVFAVGGAYVGYKLLK